MDSRHLVVGHHLRFPSRIAPVKVELNNKKGRNSLSLASEEGGFGVYYQLENHTKNHPKPQKKNWIKPKTACKTVKTYKFSPPSYQTSNWSDTMATSGAYRGFVAIRIEWRRTIAAQVEVKLQPKRAMSTKTEKPKFYGTKTDLKNSQTRKTENPNVPSLRFSRRFKRRKDGDSIRTLPASISLTSTRKQFATRGDLQYHTS